MKEEITSEIKGLLLESQRGLLNILKSRPETNVPGENKNTEINESRCSYIPTRSVRTIKHQENGTNVGRNIFANSQRDGITIFRPFEFETEKSKTFEKTFDIVKQQAVAVIASPSVMMEGPGT